MIRAIYFFIGVKDLAMKVKDKRNIANWVIQAKTGDREALERLSSFYLKRLVKFFRKRTRDPFLADDLTQETMVRFLEGIERVQDPWAFDAWICRIAKRVVWEYYKRKLHLEIFIEDFNSLPVITKKYKRKEEKVNFTEDILKNIKNVSQKEISLIMEHHGKGVPLKTLAERERISLSGIKMRLLRARKKIKPFLKEMADNGYFCSSE